MARYTGALLVIAAPTLRAQKMTLHQQCQLVSCPGLPEGAVPAILSSKPSRGDVSAHYTDT
eukprot:3166897-Amphidinium_carterae.1